MISPGSQSLTADIALSRKTSEFSPRSTSNTSPRSVSNCSPDVENVPLSVGDNPSPHSFLSTDTRNSRIRRYARVYCTVYSSILLYFTLYIHSKLYALNCAVHCIVCGTLHCIVCYIVCSGMRILNLRVLLTRCFLFKAILPLEIPKTWSIVSVYLPVASSGASIVTL